jgi:hypothetical protein
LLLNFFDAITFFRQYQRENIVNEETGEIMIKTHPEDIELAFSLLKNCLFRRADELSTSARGFYNWLQKYLNEAQTKQFTALDVRKTKRVHPRTLNRYLQELTLFHYIQIAGGNKYREGYRYKITNLDETSGLNGSIEKALQTTLKNVWDAYNSPKTPDKTEVQQNPPTTPINPPTTQKTKRSRIDEKEDYTFKFLLELEAQQPKRTYLPDDFTAITKRSWISEAKYLRRLWEQGKLNRKWKDRKYFYTLATTDSKTAGQHPPTNTKSPTTKGKESKTTQSNQKSKIKNG